LLANNKSCLDLSSIQLDGSHTPVKRGRDAVSYQGRKKNKTTNALFLTDKNGLPLVMFFPVSGNHNDLFNIENVFPEMLSNLEQIGIKPDGLFMNANAGFDSKKKRQVCKVNGIVANIDFNKGNSKGADYEGIWGK
jgi:hypothetical protein